MSTLGDAPVLGAFLKGLCRDVRLPMDERKAPSWLCSMVPGEACAGCRPLLEQARPAPAPLSAKALALLCPECGHGAAQHGTRCTARSAKGAGYCGCTMGYDKAGGWVRRAAP